MKKVHEVFRAKVEKNALEIFCSDQLQVSEQQYPIQADAP